MVMFTFMAMSEVALVLSVLVEVVDGICSRKYQGFLEALLEAHPPLGWEF